MKKQFLGLLHCPKCLSNLDLLEIESDANGKVKIGELTCASERCSMKYPIINYVPRFVKHGDYAQSFGEQWKTFASTQIDNSCLQESKKRWQSEIGWDENDIKGKKVIEFGSGAGRFVDIVSRLGAELVVGVDITSAVDGAQNTFLGRDNVLFIQADFFNLPLKKNLFDFVYSIGVLHHTPDPEKAFKQMLTMMNDTAEIGLSLYEISLYERPPLNSLPNSTKELLWAINLWRVEFFRVFTTRIPGNWFLAYCKYFIPLVHYLNKVPIVRYLRYFVPSTCYRDLPKEWSMVDTNDTYATKIVHQYRHKEIFQWFMRGDVQNIIVHDSIPGWVSLTGGKAYKKVFTYDKYTKCKSTI